MNTLFIILAATKTAAAIEIIVMLLVAGIIAFFTAYLYYKPIYLAKLKILEDEKKEQKKEIHLLNDEITGLKAEIDDLKMNAAETAKKNKKK